MSVEVAQAASWPNPRLAPRLERLAALVYADGGSLAEDRDGHVRSASALRRFGDRLLIVQDDVRALALRDHELHFIDAPDELCKRQLRVRSAALSAGTAWTTDAEFDAITVHFQEPSDDEGFNIVRHERA
jgi:hypothetical protein